jgi:lysophospholipase L1-like esterase
MVGDSTCEGVGDTLRSTLFGWPGRFGKGIGDLVDCNVDVYDWEQYLPSGGGGSPLGSASYSGPFSIRTSTSPSVPTLKVNNAGIGSAVMSKYSTSIVDSNTDLVVIWNGFNENSSFIGYYDSFISAIRAYAPTIPIIVTTQNYTTATSEFGHSLSFASIFNTIVGHFLSGKTMTLNPLIQVSDSDSYLWVFDSRHQTDMFSSDFVDGLHPTAGGYDKVTAHLLTNLIGSSITLAAPTLSATTFGAFTKGVAFSQTLSATSQAQIRWAITLGSLPLGLSLNPDTGQISGTPTSLGTYNFTIEVSNVGYGSLASQQTFTVNVNGLPFVPTGQVKLRRKMGAFLHPVTMKVKRSGSFSPIIFRR